MRLLTVPPPKVILQSERGNPKSRYIPRRIHSHGPIPVTSAHDSYLNAPAAAWAWLTQQLSGLDEIPGPSFSGEWSKFRSQKDGHGTKILFLTDWSSDFWIAQTQRTAIAFLDAVWRIPARLDQWPTLEMQDSSLNTLTVKKETNSASLLDRLTKTDPRRPSGSDPIGQFYDLVGSSDAHRDAAMTSANQIRAWLATAFGDLLSGVALTPVDGDQTRDLLVREVKGRISDVDSLSSEDRSGFTTDYGCAILYNTHLTDEGFERVAVRQGQGRDWQHHWAWLSVPQDASAMQATLRLAGLLLMNEPLFSGLTATIQGGNEQAQKRALCVMRRWLLTTKVLAWMFDALQHDWTSIRPQDLACFAFSALAPTWPRRAFAVSHRSREAKPVLSGLNMWKSPHAAIDASYVPAWETNTGMIWSLFASVPLILRVKSATYLESEWCRREHEMSEYLIERSDFLEGRVIADMGVDDLKQLDVSLFENVATSGTSARPKPFSAPKDEFPPYSLVLVADLPLELDVAVLRAGGALRLINALVQNPELANELASHVAAGDKIKIDAPTNNADGWAAYGKIFRDLESLLQNTPDKHAIPETPSGRFLKRPLSLQLPPDYSALDVQRDRASAGEIPDLSGEQYLFADVVAALEWQRTVFEWFVNERFGDKVMVDISELAAEEWTTLPHMTVARGVLALNRGTPTWIMQRADQNAHLWPGFRDQPIFTRHFDGQFSWLKPVFVSPRYLVYYLANSGFSFGSDLQAAMLAAIVRSAGVDAIRLEQRAEGVSLVVPAPKSFFLVANAGFQQTN